MAQPATAQANAMLARAFKDKMNEKKDRFGDAGLIPPPEVFTRSNQEEEVLQWQDWRLCFRSWLFFAQEEYRKDLDKAERAEKPLCFIDFSLEGHEGSEKLFSIPTGVLRNRPLKILRSVEDGNGFLQAYLSHPVFGKDRSILQQVLGLERLAEEYKTWE